MRSRKSRDVSRALGATFVALLATVPAHAAQGATGASRSGSLRAALTAKQVAAPPQDVVDGLVRLPDPRAIVTRSRAAWIPVAFERDAEGWAFERELPVERAGELTVALASPGLDGWSLALGAPDEAPRPIAARVAAGTARERRQALGEPLRGFEAAGYELAGAPAGTWRVRVSARGDAPPAPGFLVFAGAGDTRLASSLTTNALLAGEPIHLAARLHEEGDDAPLPGLADELWLYTEGDWGRGLAPMLDDGRHEDGAAGDGVYGAALPAHAAGEVLARVVARGRSGEGVFELSTLHAFDVLERRAVLTGGVQAHVLDELRLGLEVEAWLLAPCDKLLVAAEVWGTDAAGEAVPVCWLARMVAPGRSEGAVALPLALDGRWLDLAGARPPLELRALRVQDPATFVPYDLVERAPLAVGALPPGLGAQVPSVGRAMLMGPGFGTTAQSAPMRALAGGRIDSIGTLVLSHGYCSGGGIWPSADFADPKMQFVDANQNRTHDEFALLLQAFGAGHFSWGFVGHSQGGMAALHLYTYYASGLDNAAGDRLIQTVGSPYQGTPLASLGGFSCGVNDDMTPSGAALWLAGIPGWARSQVWYRTTSNAGSVCNFLSNLVLSSPNDGVIEQARGQLPGANNVGHVTGWCHTTGMSEPAHYTDHARNQTMDAQAAR